MKMILTCLLGIAMHLGQPAWAEKPATTHRIVDCALEGVVLLANSDSEDGHITKVQIYNTNGPTLVLEKTYYDYAVEVDVSELAAGNYQAKVITEYAPVHSEYFTIN